MDATIEQPAEIIPIIPPAELSRLFIDLQPGESVTIGDAVIRIVAKSGRRVKLSIEAPNDVSISSDLVRQVVAGAILTAKKISK